MAIRLRSQGWTGPLAVTRPDVYLRISWPGTEASPEAQWQSWGSPRNQALRKHRRCSWV